MEVKHPDLTWYMDLHGSACQQITAIVKISMLFYGGVFLLFKVWPRWRDKTGYQVK